MKKYVIAYTNIKKFGKRYSRSSENGNQEDRKANMKQEPLDLLFIYTYANIYTKEKAMNSNRERLETLTDREYANELKSIIQNPLNQYIDINKWLKATSPDLIYKGKKARYKESGKKIDCLLVEKRKMFNQLYACIIVPERSEVLCVPEEKVTELC